MKRLPIFLFISLGLMATAGETFCTGFACTVAVPTSATAVVSTNVRLDRAQFTNTTAGALTITITDQSTNCGGSPCDLFKTVSIAANTVYQIDFHGVPAPGGFKWSASNTGINGWVSWY